MRLTSLIILTTALAAMAAPAPATAQALTQRNMSLEIARALADGAIAAGIPARIIGQRDGAAQA